MAFFILDIFMSPFLTLLLVDITMASHYVRNWLTCLPRAFLPAISYPFSNYLLLADRGLRAHSHTHSNASPCFVVIARHQGSYPPQDLQRHAPSLPSFLLTIISNMLQTDWHLYMIPKPYNPQCPPLWRALAHSMFYPTYPICHLLPSSSLFPVSPMPSLSISRNMHRTVVILDQL